MGGRVRYGMVGGGAGAFIGAVHRSAAALDDELELVCGAFSSDAERSRRAGAALHLADSRSYADYRAMFAAEAALPESERMEFVAIVTPNHLHLPVALEALRHGFHVLSDKPATVSVEECLKLRNALDETGLLYGLTHPYVAYPVIAEAKARIARGDFGAIRKILVEYTQGWLAQPIERAGNRQAAWRTDPGRAGPSGCFGDIGVHAFNLAEHVAGVRVTELCAELNTLVRGRALDDDGAVLLRFANGARGVLAASQICVGDENNLRLRVYGERASLDWQQMEPNSLWIKHADKPAELLRTASGYLGAEAAALARIPAGHPEGYIEAFANVYRAFAAAVRERSGSAPARASAFTVPGIAEALRGMAFIETALRASASDSKWHPFPEL